MPLTYNKSVLLIAGPTASGKSAVAIAQAQARGGVIINADSMQVYKELRIITARPSVEEEQLTPHRLFGHIGGSETYSTASWLAEAEAEILNCWSNRQLPIICGGTGLYFTALEQGLAKLPPIAPDIRDKWRNFQGDLHVELKHRHPESAARLNAADRQRLIRSLEVFESTGKALIDWQKEAQNESILRGTNIERMFMNVPREELYGRAEHRFDAMIELGAIDEIRALPQMEPTLPLMKAIGVPELLAHINGELSLEDAKVKAKTATRNYIKRQMTWFRGQMKNWHS
jgi:tRNA dimethylallyltransferase